MYTQNNYGFFDRLLHHFVFSTPFLQKILCELENDVFKKKLKSIESKNEVFITGLPRAGTTLMLELLHATGEFSSYTYRQMPFILTPLIWQKFSKPFQRLGTAQKRAHDDGMAVSFDSPEAFEEIIWLTYYKKKMVFHEHLSPITKFDLTEEFIACLKSSVKKCILLKSDPHSQAKPLRYLSKNNSNSTRVDLISDLFPTSKTIVMFRHPLAHISSTMKQHKLFTKQQGDDRFSRKYMEWLGHFEFGASFKPFNFGLWLETKARPFKVNEDFWLQYWIEAYSHLLKIKNEQMVFVDFDSVLKNPQTVLGQISDHINLSNKSTLLSASSTLRSPTTYPVKANTLPTDTLAKAYSIYDRLLACQQRIFSTS